jgi:serine/threonine-protein kinase RsbT
VSISLTEILPSSERTLDAARPPVHALIREESDVVMARKYARDFAVQEGLSERAVNALVTATSEIVRNVIVHATTGELSLTAVKETHRHGVVVVVRDKGPGIADFEQALRDGYSTGRGLGLGLPSAKRLMDEFELASEIGEGTTVTMKMWTASPTPISSRRRHCGLRS